MLRPAVEAWPSLARLKIDVPAELRGDDDIVAKRLDGLAKDSLVLERAVRFGTVEKHDTMIVGRADDVQHSRACTGLSFDTCGACSGHPDQLQRPPANRASGAPSPLQEVASGRLGPRPARRC